MLKSVLFLFSITLAFSQNEKTADFFIAENPTQFEILDRYQQKISSSDRKLFNKFTPWKIIEEYNLLSDQFTQAMKVGFAGKRYFFVRDDQGNLKHGPQDGLSYLIKDAELISEEFTVLQNGAVLFSEASFNKRNKNYKRTYLEKNTLLRTVFKTKKDYFVQLLGAKKQYGWVRPSGKLSLKKTSGRIISANTDLEIEGSLLDRVRLKIEGVNVVYSRLFKKLNSSFKQDKPVPFWSLESNGKGMVIQLQNNNSDKFNKSIDYFVNEIETIFAGSPFNVFSSGTAIEILRK